MTPPMVISMAVLCVACGPALADQAAPTAPQLPSLALNPQASSPQAASPWTGLYVGSEVMAAFAKGSKPGFGGAAFAGYNRELDNNLIIGVEGSTGYAPYLFTRGPSSGFNFAETNVLVGYDMGRFMPYVTAGVALAKPNFFGTPAYTGAADSMNALFSPGNDLSAFGTVGAGFNYAVTDKLTFGMQVTAGGGHGALFPGP